MSNTVNDDTLAFAVTPSTPKIRFVASLSDGRTVFQDNRKGQLHAWIRLSEWLDSNPDVSITTVRLQGPQGIDLKMPKGQKGYFFGYKNTAVWGGPQYKYVGIGYFDGQKVNIAWYRRPRFDHSFTEERTEKDAGFFLIRVK